mmetsp:Transcript_94788/g.300753  ORF Transcript_94788/g.300753 Transcript_94788/m.300753 type:complete len:355 (+) Transcript_94788:366-1430(+)
MELQALPAKQALAPPPSEALEGSPGLDALAAEQPRRGRGDRGRKNKRKDAEVALPALPAGGEPAAALTSAAAAAAAAQSLEAAKAQALVALAQATSASWASSSTAATAPPVQALPAAEAASGAVAAPAESEGSEEQEEDFPDPANNDLWRPIAREPLQGEFIRFRTVGKGGLSGFRVARCESVADFGGGPCCLLRFPEGSREELPPGQLLQVSVQRTAGPPKAADATGAQGSSGAGGAAKGGRGGARPAAAEKPPGKAAEPVAEEMPEVARRKTEKLRHALQRQVDYYFGEANYAQDNWLRAQADGDGWTSLRLVAKFNRMKELTDDVDLVRSCLKTSQVVELSDCGDYLRRRE